MLRTCAIALFSITAGCTEWIRVDRAALVHDEAHAHPYRATANELPAELPDVAQLVGVGRGLAHALHAFPHPAVFVLAWFFND
jgi:hypothetical protein